MSRPTAAGIPGMAQLNKISLLSLLCLERDFSLASFGIDFSRCNVVVFCTGRAFGTSVVVVRSSAGFSLGTMASTITPSASAYAASLDFVRADAWTMTGAILHREGGRLTRQRTRRGPSQEMRRGNEEKWATCLRRNTTNTTIARRGGMRHHVTRQIRGGRIRNTE